MNNLKKRLTERGYPINFLENVLSEVKQEGRKQSLAKKKKNPIGSCLWLHNSIQQCLI